MSDLDSSNEDYEPDTDEEDYDDIDIVLDMDEMRNVLTDASSPFLHDINISTFEDTGLKMPMIKTQTKIWTKACVS